MTGEGDSDGVVPSRIVTRRIYEAAHEDDGYRLLVDRVWPRGMRRERAAIDEWAKDVAPSSELRRWFGHRPDRFDAFAERYLEELAAVEPRLHELIARAAPGRLTLLFAARETRYNHAVVLAARLRDLAAGDGRPPKGAGE